MVLLLFVYPVEDTRLFCLSWGMANTTHLTLRISGLRLVLSQVDACRDFVGHSRAFGSLLR